MLEFEDNTLLHGLLVFSHLNLLGIHMYMYIHVHVYS